LIDELEGQRSCEFRSAIAIPLPSRMFVRMMDLDRDRYREFAGWVDAITAGGDRGQIGPALAGLRTYVSEVIQQRLGKPGEDPVSHLLGSGIDGCPLTVQRVHEMCCFLFLAGLDTVTKALTFIMNWLARHPEQQQALRADPSTIPDAVEELLRRLTFVNLARRLTRDYTLSGVALRQDETLICSLAGASNDDRHFDCPEMVDFTRGVVPHLAFSTGPHACPGAPLARTELRIFLGEWLRRMPDVRIAPGFVSRGRGGMVMGMEELQLVW
jgi:cytochrome P450